MHKPDFQARIRKLAGLMYKNNLDAALINSRNDIFYYTGEDIGESCFLLVQGRSRPCIFLTSLSNYVKETERFDVFYMKGLSDIAKKLKGFRRVGFDEYTTSCWAFSELRKSGTQLRPSASLIKEPRTVKDRYEIAQIRKAAQTVSRVAGRLGSISGKSELQVADIIEMSLRRAGARASFDSIVAAGKNSAFVHHTPGKAKITDRDMVIVDTGAKVNGYCSDFTRTFCRKPGPKERRLAEDVSGMQSELMDMARDGVKYDDLQGRYESIMRRKKYRVMHSFGHGIGTAVHERPSKGDVLKEGMVITVEPGAYIRGLGGCRMEDMIVIRKGRAKILTRNPD